MLKVKDLRVGNYICSSLTKSVVEVSTKVLRLMESEIRVKGETTYKGIPITEDLLLKCGFSRGLYIDNLFFTKLDVVNGDYSEIIIDMSDGNVEVHLDINNFSIEVECKHLHQLQNLYHSVTGKELEVKLN